MDQDRFATCPRTITEWSWHERLTLAESYVIAGVSTYSLRIGDASDDRKPVAIEPEHDDAF